MEQWAKIELWEWVFYPIYILVIYYFAYRIRNVNLITRNRSEYKYFIGGLTAKLTGCLFFCLIYTFYYDGGDSRMYFESVVPFANLLETDFSAYLKVMFNPPSPEMKSLFTVQTGVPYSYIYFDDKTCMVVKLTSVFNYLGAKSYLLTSTVLAALSYVGPWKLYRLFVNYYPSLKLHLAMAILFVPSVIFWGSGILKDTYTFAGACLFIFYFHEIFIAGKWKSLLNHFLLVMSFFLIISIKPYIVMVLLPSILVWFMVHNVRKSENSLVSAIVAPFVVSVLLAGVYLLFTSLGDMLSKFSLDEALQTAQIIQHDLQQSYYGSNSFNIGAFDGTATGALTLMPNAVFAGLYRPTLLEAASPVMLLSALENTLLLILTPIVLFRIGMRKTWKILMNNPIVAFGILFSILFGFVIGLTTANFGALVRFKIPLIPLFLSSLMIMIYLANVRFLGIRPDEEPS